MVLLLAACSSSPVTWSVGPAYDVPPPPGKVTLELGPAVAEPPALGATLMLSSEQHTVRAEVVDARVDPEGTTLTVYADEQAQSWLDAPGTQVRLEVR